MRSATAVSSVVETIVPSIVFVPGADHPGATAPRTPVIPASDSILSISTPEPSAPAAPPLGAAGYFVQQLANGLALGAIYCLIAIGYAQVFSLLEIVNFAFGELYMMGGYFALIALVVVGVPGLDHGVAG